MVDNNFIPSNIRFLRTIAGLSQEQLAKKVDLNRGNITSYERGVAKPAIETLKRLAEFFKVELVHIIQTDLTQNIGLVQSKNQEAAPPSNGVPSSSSDNIIPSLTPSISSMLQEVTSYEVKQREVFYQNVARIANSLERIEKSLEKLDYNPLEEL